MKTSQKGIDLIKSFEGCRLTAYQDVVGVWTIGYGHTSNVKEGMKITQAEADRMLVNELASFEAKVEKYSKYNWSQNEFDALVSYCYNIGNIKGLTADGTRTRAEIIIDIPKHNKAGGKVYAGLTRRRNAELALFGEYDKEKFVKDVEFCTGCKVDGKPDTNLLNSTPTVSSKINSRHKVVWAIQMYLNKLGFNCGTVDGDFGSKTDAGVKKFQSWMKKPDGELTTKQRSWKTLLGMK